MRKYFKVWTLNRARAAIVKLNDQIHESLKKNHYKLAVFTDLFKAFDAVDHFILLRKLETYGIKN